MEGKPRVMRFLLTILLNAAGIAILALVIVVPNLPQFRSDRRVDNLLAVALCNPDEYVLRQPSNNPILSSAGLSITPYCVNRAGQSRDVTVRWLLIGAGGFGITMLFGVVLDIMLLLNAFRHTVLRLAIRRNRPASFATTPTAPPAADVELRLSDKLKQLEDVHRSGSITDEEYQRMRQEILNKT